MEAEANRSPHLPRNNHAYLHNSILMITPMLSKITEKTPSGKDYLYEVKLDGQRTIAEIKTKKLLLYTRNFQDVTSKYPELSELVKCIQGSAILDGEIVALENGIPSFELLQQRMNLRDIRKLRTIAEEVPVLYYVFDILEWNGKSLLKVPLLERKKILNRILKTTPHVKLLPFFDSSDLILAKASEFGYEGIVAKKKDSFYLPGQRTDLWQKYKFQNTDSFVIAGWTEGGRSKQFGALLIGKYRGKNLIHVGRAGTGFTDKTIELLMELFRKFETSRSPFNEIAEKIPEKVHWLKPQLVAEVKFKEWTKAGTLRAPVYMGLRKDIKATSCRF
jgi:bifunctional non-homologous end joining protein LigD